MFTEAQLKSAKKYLTNNKWYHGTRLSSLENIRKGISVDINRMEELDFGNGFYLTNRLNSAGAYINSVIKYDPPSIIEKMSEDYTKGIVLEFTLDNLLDIFMEDKYKGLIFPNYDEGFADFVFKNRIQPTNQHHDADFIFGVQTDSVPTRVINQYRNNKLTKEEVLQEFQKSTSFKQLSLHNQPYCDNLTVDRIYWSENKKEAHELWQY